MSKVFNMVGGGGGKNISSIIITGLESTDTVTCIKDGKSYTVTWNDTKQHFEIVGLPIGSYTVTATDGTKTITETVLIDIAGVYEIEITFRTYLFKDGDPCKNVTGGWRKSSNYSNGTLELLESYMIVQANNSQFICETVNAINTTPYTTLCVEWETSDIVENTGPRAGIYFLKSGSMIYQDDDAQLETFVNLTRTVTKTDFIKHTDGFVCAVGCCHGYSPKATIYKIWLE